MRRKPLLRIAGKIVWEFLRFRPAQLLIGGTVIPFLAYSAINCFYPLPSYAILTVAGVSFFCLFLGAIDLFTVVAAREREDEEKENKAKVRNFEHVEKELEKIKDRLEKIEKRLMDTDSR